MHARLVGKAEGGAVGIAGVVKIDSIGPADVFQCHFKRNSLRIEVARGICSFSQAVRIEHRMYGVGIIGSSW